MQLTEYLKLQKFKRREEEKQGIRPPEDAIVGTIWVEPKSQELYVKTSDSNSESAWQPVRCDIPEGARDVMDRYYWRLASSENLHMANEELNALREQLMDHLSRFRVENIRRIDNAEHPNDSGIGHRVTSFDWPRPPLLTPFNIESF